MEELDSKIKTDEEDESNKAKTLHEDKLKQSDDVNSNPNDNEDLLKNDSKCEDENVNENNEKDKEQNDSLKKEDGIEDDEQQQEEDDFRKESNDNQMKEEDAEHKEGDDEKEPLDNKEEKEDDKVKEEYNKRQDEKIEDQTYHFSNYPNLHYNYQSFEKSNDYLGQSKGGFERLPYTYNLKNSTNYISHNDRYSSISSFNANKDRFDYGNMKSSINYNKDDVLIEKTKKVLNEKDTVENQLEEKAINNKRSYSSINRNPDQCQYQPQRSNYISSYNTKENENNLNQVKPIEENNRAVLLNKYNTIFKDNEYTYSINSSTLGMPLYSPNPRIQAIKEKYQYTPYKSSLLGLSSGIGNKYTTRNQRISYQYESNPLNRFGAYKSRDRYSNPYSSSLIQSDNNYSSRFKADRLCCCCHCKRGFLI